MPERRRRPYGLIHFVRQRESCSLLLISAIILLQFQFRFPYWLRSLQRVLRISILQAVQQDYTNKSPTSSKPIQICRANSAEPMMRNIAGRNKGFLGRGSAGSALLVVLVMLGVVAILAAVASRSVSGAAREMSAARAVSQSQADLIAGVEL